MKKCFFKINIFSNKVCFLLCTNTNSRRIIYEYFIISFKLFYIGMYKNTAFGIECVILYLYCRANILRK